MKVSSHCAWQYLLACQGFLTPLNWSQCWTHRHLCMSSLTSLTPLTDWSGLTDPTFGWPFFINWSQGCQDNTVHRHGASCDTHNCWWWRLYSDNWIHILMGTLGLDSRQPCKTDRPIVACLYKIHQEILSAILASCGVYNWAANYIPVVTTAIWLDSWNPIEIRWNLFAVQPDDCDWITQNISPGDGQHLPFWGVPSCTCKMVSHSTAFCTQFHISLCKHKLCITSI